MKKRILCVFCAVFMLAFFTACGGDDLTGTWEATIDVTETIGGGIIAEINKSMPELEEYIDMSGLTLTISTTFNDDGTYISAVTEESFSAMMDSAATKAADGFTTYANKLISELNFNIDINILLGLSEGETLESRIKDQFNIEDFRKIIADNSQSGVYKAKDGKLFTAENIDSFNEEMYETYVLNGDALEITGSVGMEADVGSLMTKTYPLTYTKIS